MSTEEVKEKRRKALEKARAVRAANRAQVKVTDVVPEADSALPKRKVGCPPKAEVSTGKEMYLLSESDSASALVLAIKSVNYDALSYDAVCELLTAYREGFDRAGEVRRQKQEQLQASSLRAPCNTCGRQIDISKSGKFQIRTVRDQFFQPMNVYYCSQECVLAENLKGKERPKPGPRVA